MEKIPELFEKDKFAKSCGIKIEDFKPGQATCSMIITEKHHNGIGIVMGGALFTLADFAFSVAAYSQNDLPVSLNVFISYLKKCSSGKVTALAKEISRSKRIGVYNISITDENGQRIAEVTGTCYFQVKKTALEE